MIGMEDLILALRAAARSVRADMARWEADHTDRLSRMPPVLVDAAADPDAAADEGGTARPARLSIPMLALLRPIALRMTTLTLELPVVVEEHPSPDDPNATVLALGAADAAPEGAKRFRLALELAEDGTVDVSLDGQLLESFKGDGQGESP